MNKQSTSKYKNLHRLLFLYLLSLLSPLVNAQYPDHPVHLVVPFAPAGTVDGIARLFSVEFGKQLGQPVIIDNKSGSGGSIGISSVISSNPDGYTLLLGNIATASAPALYPKLGLDPKTLEPITLIGRSAYILVVRKDFPANTYQELIQLLKTNPSKYNYSSAGAGSAIHLAAELFRIKAGVDVLHIPYKGAGPALNALLAGDVQMMFGSISEMKPMMESAKIKGIAVSSAKRMSAIPNIPSLAESGLTGFDVPGWYGVYAPKNTPENILIKLIEAASRALASQGVKDLLVRYQMDPSIGGAKEAGDLLKLEINRWTEVIAQSKIQTQ